MRPCKICKHAVECDSPSYNYCCRCVEEKQRRHRERVLRQRMSQRAPDNVVCEDCKQPFSVQQIPERNGHDFYICSNCAAQIVAREANYEKSAVFRSIQDKHHYHPRAS